MCFDQSFTKQSSQEKLPKGDKKLPTHDASQIKQWIGYLYHILPTKK
jgi:hypothetical protein